MSIYGDSGGGSMAAELEGGKGSGAVIKCSNLTDETRKKIMAGLGVVVAAALVYYLYTASFFATEGLVVGRFVTSSKALSWDDARDFCESKYAGLASIHSAQEQTDAVAACKAVDGGLSKVWDGSDTGTSSKDKRPVGCWIGLADVDGEGSFTWSDKSNLQFSAWSPGEPTEGHHSAKNADGKASLAAAEGEDAVHMTFVQQAAAGGAASHWDDEQGSWNDNHVNGEHGHNENNAFGFFPLCQISPPTAPAEGSRGSLATAWVTKTNKESCDGKYVAIPRPLSWTDAHHYCTSNGYYSLASIHSWQDQAAAVEACKGLTGSLSHGPTEAGSIPHGCWIGMHDSKSENAFEWRDATYVNYHAWAPGEPNSWGQRKSNGNGGTMALDAGEVGFDENYVEMDFRGGLGDGSSQGGAWNDAANTGLASVERAGETAGQCFGCHGTYGLYPLCERRPPSDSPRVGSRTWTPPKPAVRGRFVAVPVAHKWTSAESVCHTHNYCGLASIHTMEEQRHAEAACHAITHSSGSNTNSGLPNACWIGLNQRDNDGTPGQQFRWTDGTTVEFQHFSPGEPNNWGAEGFNGAATGNGEGEVGVEIAFIGRGNSYWQGYWNDDHDKGTAGHNTNNYKPRDTSAFDWSYHTQRQGIGSTDTACFGCSGVFGQYALCNAQPAATCNPQTSVTIQGEACPTGVQVFTEHCCNPALTCHQELDNADGVAPVAACCNLGTDALTGKPVQPRCHVNMCHNDGQFTEVDFPVVDDMCGCIQACLAHPQASSYQYNAGGWCGCLENTGDDLHNAANTMTDAVPGACSLCSVDHIQPTGQQSQTMSCQQQHHDICPATGR